MKSQDPSLSKWHGQVERDVVLVVAHNTQELKPELKQRLHLKKKTTSETTQHTRHPCPKHMRSHSLISSIRAMTRLYTFLQASCRRISLYKCYYLSLYLWVSRHETVDVVVDLLEHKASVHQVETALQKNRQKKVSR